MYKAYLLTEAENVCEREKDRNFLFLHYRTRRLVDLHQHLIKNLYGI